MICYEHRFDGVAVLIRMTGEAEWRRYVRCFDGERFIYEERRHGSEGALLAFLMREPDQMASVQKCARVMGVSEGEIRQWAEDSTSLFLEEGDIVSADPDEND